MKKKNLIILIGGLLLVMVGFAGVFIYNNIYFKNKSVVETSTEGSFPANPKKADFGYHETDSVKTEGQAGVVKGTYGRVEGTTLYFAGSNGFSVKYNLNPDQIVIQCTNEDLANVDSFDLHKVTSVKLATYQRLYNTIRTGAPAFIITRDLSGNIVVDTIVITNTDCPNSL